MNYDRRVIESLKRTGQSLHLPFVRTFILLTSLIFVLSVVLR